MRKNVNVLRVGDNFGRSGASRAHHVKRVELDPIHARGGDWRIDRFRNAPFAKVLVLWTFTKIMMLAQIPIRR